MEAATRKGRRPPKWFTDEPPRGPLDSFYITAFLNLSSTRLFEQGPIPWDRIVEYGHHRDMDAGIIDAFLTIIRMMDAGFLGWTAKQKPSSS